MNKFDLINSKKIYQGKSFSVYEEQVSIPTGQIVNKAVVKHNGAVVIIPQGKDKELYLVRQYRHAIGKDILEFPAGTLELAEKPLDCAKREIKEEVGFAASKWEFLGNIYPAPGFCDEFQHIYLASELTPCKEPHDEDEFIEVEQMSVSEFELIIAKGKFVDGKSIAAFFLARLKNFL